MKKRFETTLVLSLMLNSASLFGASYYVSSTGNNPGSGTFADPWSEIQSAAEVMVAGDTCIISGGTYRETVTLANSGTSANPITYRAAPGETVVITGLDPVTSSWTHTGGSDPIYQTTLPDPLGIPDHEDQLFVMNGTNVKYLWEARWPNLASTEYTFQALKDSFQIAEGPTDADPALNTPSTLTDSDLTQVDDYWIGATVWYVGGKGGWLGKTSRISDSTAAVDAAPGTLTLQDVDTTKQDPVNGSEYYITGVLAELDAENEWFIDRNDRRTLYVWAPGGLAPTNIEVKRRVLGMVINGKSYVHVEGVQFLACSIQLVGSDYCELDGITARYIYGSDQSLSYGANNQRDNTINIVGDFNTIKNSDLAYSSGSMIHLKGTGNQVINNLIRHTTFLGNYAASIEFDECYDTLISHNTIHDSGRGIIAGVNRNSIIQHNKMHDFMWLSSDGAAIYFWGMDLGNSEFRYNEIYNGIGMENGWGNLSTYGIYMDNGAHNVLIHHNLIYDMADDTSACIKFNQPGNFRLAFNNTLVGNNAKSFTSNSNGDYQADSFGSVLGNTILTGEVELKADIANLRYINNKDSSNGFDEVTHLNGDYSLTNVSPAIDSGVDDATITNTYISNAVMPHDLGIIGSAPDAGAYEYGGYTWEVGHDFNNVPTPDTTRRTSRYMNLLLDSAFDEMTNWVPIGSPSIVPYQGVRDDWLKQKGEKRRRGMRTWLRLNNQGDGVEQTVTGLKPDTYYHLSGWLASDVGESIEFGVKDFGGDTIGQSANNEHFDVRKDIFFKTGATDTTATVFITKTSSGSAYVYADDFGLIEDTSDLIHLTEDFASGLAGWSITDDVTAAFSAQSPSPSGVNVVQGALLKDTAATGTRMDHSISVPDSRWLYIQFDFLYTGTVLNPGVQLLNGNTKGLNLHMSGDSGSMQYNNGGTWTFLATSLVADTWYRLTLSVLPEVTVNDQFDLRVQSLDSGLPLDVTYNGLGFQGNLNEFNNLRFHYNVSQPGSVGGEFRIDNVLVTTSTSELNYDLPVPLASDLPVTDGLLLHLDASMVSGASEGDPVETWWNLVDPATPVNAVSAGVAPIYHASGFNGMPALRFDGDDDWLDIGTLRAGEGAVEMFMVAQSTATGGKTWQRFISAYSSGTNDSSEPNWTVLRPNSSGAPQTVSPSIVTQSYSSGRHIDGIDLARNAQATDQHFEGDIAEAVIFDRQLTNVERTELNYHLAQKYSFAYSSYLDTVVDSDSDGQSDLNELIAGTRLDDPVHYFTTQYSATGGDFSMSWDSVTEREYTVKRSFDLEDWDNVGTYTGDGLGKLFEESIDVNLNPSVFYHMVIAHP